MLSTNIVSQNNFVCSWTDILFLLMNPSLGLDTLSISNNPQNISDLFAISEVLGRRVSREHIWAECLQGKITKGGWCRRDIIKRWYVLIRIVWIVYLTASGFVVSISTKVTFWNQTGIWKHLVGEGLLMKKYREYPAVNLKRPFIKNSSHREGADGLLRKKT